MNIEHQHQCQGRSDSIITDFVLSLRDSVSITSHVEFDYFIKTILRKWMPHYMAMWGIVDIESGQFIQMFNIDFPKEYIDSMTKAGAANIYMDCQAFSQWSKTFETVEVSKNCLVGSQIEGNICQLEQRLGTTKIENIIIAGLPGLVGRRATVFCFATENAETFPTIKELVDLALPFLHQAVVKQYSREHVSNKNKTTNILTRREKQMLELIYKGLEYQDIANFVGISVNTVRSHIQNIFMKFHVSNRTQALVKAINLGILSIQSDLG